MVCLLSGCAQIMIPGTIAGAGELYRYNTTNLAKQTFLGNMTEVTDAAKSTFEKMNIKLSGIDGETDKTVLYGTTSGLDITVKLEIVTATTIRATVNATKNHVIKDKSTAEEILTQMSRLLHLQPKPLRKFSSVFAKNSCAHPIKLAIYYLRYLNEEETWGAQGWFLVEPRQKKHIADTKNRYIYLYAESREGEKLIWDGDSYHQFNGRQYGFFKVDMGQGFADFTQSFMCD
jgi:hypothetical protein